VEVVLMSDADARIAKWVACSQCGERNNSKWAVCSACGADLDDAEPWPARTRRKESRVGVVVRAVLALVGVIAVLGGVVAWAFESEYGGSEDRTEYVISHDAETGQAFVYGEDGNLVYEGDDIAEAEAWVDRQRGARDYTAPIVMIGGGTLLAMLVVIPFIRESRTEMALM
jgi:hypothetical protein